MYSLEQKQRNVYIGGLEKLSGKGVAIYLNDMIVCESDSYNELFVVSSDNSFYMGDYIEDEATGRLKEIRFNKVRPLNK